MKDQDVIELREVGTTIKEIARLSGRHPSTLRIWLNERGVKPKVPIFRQSRIDEAQAPVLQRMYWEEEKSVYEIAEALGVCHSTVNNRMTILGIPRRPKSERSALAIKKKRARNQCEA